MTTSIPTPAAIWAEGYDAHATGKSVGENPYVPKPTNDRVASLNMRNTQTPFVITAAQAEAGLLKVLAETDFIALQEWAGAERNGILRKLGPFTLFPQTLAWFPLTNPRKTTSGWTWTRPLSGGPTVGARADRYELRFVRTALLAGPGRVDKVPGYRSLLGASRATVTGWTDLLAGGTVVLIDFHLTTHVEAGGKYRPECPLRAARHKTEVKKLQDVAAYHVKAKRRVYVVGDTNFNGLQIPGLRSCWVDQPLKPLGGTLGASRRVDVVYTNPDVKPSAIQILDSASDHRHPIVTCPKVPR